MSTFQHRFPEQTADHDPLLPGQMRIMGSDLPKFRLHQLRHLARAFSIKMDMDAPKQQVLPVLLAAEAAGVFRGQPRDRIEFMKAFHCLDDGPLNHAPAMETSVTPVVEVQVEAPKEEIDPANLSWNELRNTIRNWYPDIKIYGKGREALEHLYRYGIFPGEDGGETENVDHSA